MKKILTAILATMFILTGCSRVDNCANDILVEPSYTEESNNIADSESITNSTEEDTTNEVEQILNNVPGIEEVLNSIVDSTDTGLTADDIEDILTDPIKSRDSKQYQELLNTIDNMFKELENNCNEIIDNSRK